MSESSDYPTLWYILLFFVSFFGVVTWYLHNFTDREQLMKLTAMSGISSMSLLVWWTFTSF